MPAEITLPPVLELSEARLVDVPGWLALSIEDVDLTVWVPAEENVFERKGISQRVQTGGVPRLVPEGTGAVLVQEGCRYQPRRRSVCSACSCSPRSGNVAVVAGP